MLGTLTLDCYTCNPSLKCSRIIGNKVQTCIGCVRGRWVSTVFNGFQWFSTVFNGFRQFLTVFNSFQLCLFECNSMVASMYSQYYPSLPIKLPQSKSGSAAPTELLLA